MNNFEWLKKTRLKNNLILVKPIIDAAKTPADLAKPSGSICKSSVRVNFTGDFGKNFCDHNDNPKACQQCAMEWLTSKQSEWTKELTLV